MTATQNSDAGIGVTRGWERRPILAIAVRATLFVAPIVAGWLAVRFTESTYWQPDGIIGLAAWVVQAVVVAAATTHVATSLAARLAPLSTMLTMTLVFPDHAPSRFGMALRAGTVKKLTRSSLQLSSDAQVAAEQAVELVAALGRHERNTRGHTERVRAHAELIGMSSNSSGNISRGTLKSIL